MTSDLSLIKSYFNLFLITVQNKHPKRYSYSNCYQWIRAMLLSETLEETEDKDSNKKMLKNLDTIYNKTTKKLNKPLPIVEFVLNKNLEERNIGRKVSIDGTEFYTHKLYQYIEEALSDMMEIATELAKKYSLDMPLNTMGSSMATGNTMDFNRM